MCASELRLHWASLFLLSSKKVCMSLVFEGGYVVANTNSISYDKTQECFDASENTSLGFFFLLKESIRKKVVIIYSQKETSAQTVEYFTVVCYLLLYNL